jgi:hypothetical protein
MLTFKSTTKTKPCQRANADTAQPKAEACGWYRVDTCHSERMNLSARLFMRRLSRCTLCYSKKLANLKHAVALFIWHFNFARVHSAHGQTPAMAAKLIDKPMTIADLLTAPF